MHRHTDVDTWIAVAGGYHRDLLVAVVEAVEADREHRRALQEPSALDSDRFSSKDRRRVPGQMPVLVRRRA